MIVLTTDADYRPRIKDRPRNPAWDVLNAYRRGGIPDLEPLARRNPTSISPPRGNSNLPRQRLVYLWNMNTDEPQSGSAISRTACRCPTVSPMRSRARSSKEVRREDDVPISATTDRAHVPRRRP